MHSASGSTVAVRLCLSAASPAGVSGSFQLGRSLPILPTGLVSRVPFQYPLRSGRPLAVRGVGREEGTSTAVKLLSGCAAWPRVVVVCEAQRRDAARTAAPAR